MLGYSGIRRFQGAFGSSERYPSAKQHKLQHRTLTAQIDIMIIILKTLQCSSTPQPNAVTDRLPLQNKTKTNPPVIALMTSPSPRKDQPNHLQSCHAQ